MSAPHCYPLPFLFFRNHSTASPPAEYGRITRESSACDSKAELVPRVVMGLASSTTQTVHTDIDPSGEIKGALSLGFTLGNVAFGDVVFDPFLSAMTSQSVV